MEAFERAVIELVSIARQQIASKYDHEKLEYRAYHNSTHTTQVIEAAHLLSEMAVKNNKVSLREARLCVLAAAFHDVIHNGDSAPDNEEQSADFAETLMKSSQEFTHQDIKHVRHMVLATKCTQKYPKLIQSPLPHDYAAKLLCDADKASFGKPYEEFYKSAMCYFHEIHGDATSDVELHKFLEVECTLLSNHSFWTNEAGIAFPHTKDNCKQLQRATLKMA